MNWINYKNFTQYQLLEQLRDCLIEEYNTIWKQTHDAAKEGVDIHDRYNITDDDPEHLRNLVWFALPIITGAIEDEKWRKYWPKTMSVVDNIPGVLNMAINFVGPHNIIPEHKDDYFDMSAEIVGEKRGYGTMIGISMPSSDPAVVGFKVGEDILGWPTGGIVSFDGYKPHSGWNNSDEWRVTAIIDIDERYWSL